MKTRVQVVQALNVQFRTVKLWLCTPREELHEWLDLIYDGPPLSPEECIVSRKDIDRECNESWKGGITRGIAD
jgi:hypothetical protein